MDKLKSLKDFFFHTYKIDIEKGIKKTEGHGVYWEVAEDFNFFYQNRKKSCIRVTNFRNCCGIKILSNFQYTDELFAKGLIEHIKYKIKTGYNLGLLLYAAANQPRIEKILIDRGFRIIWAGFNPRHGKEHKLKLYAFDLHSYNKELTKDEMQSVRLGPK